MNEIVSCYSGGRYAERPTAFKFENNELEVVKVIRRWREPDSLVFVVLVPDGRRFQLSFNIDAGRWSVEPLTRRSF